MKIRNKGFTLVEIIIVIIIIGILAGLALPKIASNITKGYAPEALQTLGMATRELDVNCQSGKCEWNTLAQTTNFSYNLSTGITAVPAATQVAYARACKLPTVGCAAPVAANYTNPPSENIVFSISYDSTGVTAVAKKGGGAFSTIAFK